VMRVRLFPAWAQVLTVVIALGACQSSVSSESESPEPRPGEPQVAPYDTLPTGAATLPCVVESVTDGDTFRCTGGRRVRLLTIDAPEMDQAPFGSSSRAKLAQLLPVGSSATLELDIQREDQYGRTLAYVRRPGVLVNRAIVRSGMAVVAVYPPNVRYVEVLRAAADSARADRAGLWATNGFECLPADHRAGRC